MIQKTFYLGNLILKLFLICLRKIPTIYTQNPQMCYNTHMKKDLKVLASHTNILSLLYDEYLSNEFLSIGGWEYIRQIFNAFLEKENIGKIA